MHSQPVRPLQDLTDDQVSSELQLCLGAQIIGDDLANPHSAIHRFRGLIAETRVLDACLTSSEILDRMNIKLRGSEVSLAAYPNFDGMGASDGTLEAAKFNRWHNAHPQLHAAARAADRQI